MALFPRLIAAAMTADLLSAGCALPAAGPRPTYTAASYYPGPDAPLDCDDPGSPAPPPEPRRGPPPPPAVDYWAIGRSDLSGGGSSLSVSRLEVGYDLTHPASDRLGVTARPLFHTLFLGGPDGTGRPCRRGCTGSGPRSSRSTIGGRGSGCGRPSPRGCSRTSTRSTGPSGCRPGPWSRTPGPTGWCWSAGRRTRPPRGPGGPIAGALWNPTDDWSVELILPRPRVVYRATDRLSVYGALQFLTDVYTVRRPGGSEGVQYQDFRAAVGGEWQPRGGGRMFAEVGAAFDRELRFEFRPDRRADPGVFVRVGGRF